MVVKIYSPHAGTVYTTSGRNGFKPPAEQLLISDTLGHKIVLPFHLQSPSNELMVRMRVIT